MASTKLYKIENTIAESNKMLRGLEDRALKLSQFLEDYPISFDGNRLSILSNTGTEFVIEKGSCVNYGKILFSKAFSETPTVLVSACYGSVLQRRKDRIKVYDINKNGFSVYGDITTKVSWFAVGN